MVRELDVIHKTGSTNAIIERLTHGTDKTHKKFGDVMHVQILSYVSGQTDRQTDILITINTSTPPGVTRSN